jgi:hypothetical protein
VVVTEEEVVIEEGVGIEEEAAVEVEEEVVQVEAHQEADQKFSFNLTDYQVSILLEEPKIQW